MQYGVIPWSFTAEVSSVIVGARGRLSGEGFRGMVMPWSYYLGFGRCFCLVTQSSDPGEWWKLGGQ